MEPHLDVVLADADLKMHFPEDARLVRPVLQHEPGVAGLLAGRIHELRPGGGVVFVHVDAVCKAHVLECVGRGSNRARGRRDSEGRLQPSGGPTQSRFLQATIVVRNLVFSIQRDQRVLLPHPVQLVEAEV